MCSKDAFEGVDELEDLRSGDEIDNGTDSDGVDSENRRDDFVQTLDPSSEDDDSDPDANPSDENSDGFQYSGEMYLDGSIPVIDDLGFGRAGERKPIAKIQRTVRKSETGEALFTRGIEDRNEHKAAKASHRLFHFGASLKDFQAVDAARQKWHHAPTLPSKVADVKGFGGMHGSFFVSEKASLERERSSTRWWQDDGGMQAFRANQASNTIDGSSALDYMPEMRSSATSCLTGPFNAQVIVKIAPGQAVALSDVWTTTFNGENLGSSSNQSKAYKAGFMLNLGSRVHCLDWAPGNNGVEQYLAVSVLPERETSGPPFEAPMAPAFTPQPLHNSNIQIWRFQRNKKGCIDTECPPELDVVLCTACGDIKELKWCPMPCSKDHPEGMRHLGLLAGIWSDGTIRIIDVAVPKNSQQTQYIQIERTGFESKPPDALCTCLTWISSTRIATGCSNGCIAIWDVADAVRSSSPNPKPVIYASVSSAYLLSITSCYPSRPGLLLSASIGGTIYMTDTSRSGQSCVSQATTVAGSRVRMGLPLLSWNDFGQFAIHGEDNFAIKGRTIRSLFSNSLLARGRSIPTSLASSPCHPSLLIGCANGEVFATNPLGRMIDPGKNETWQQIWFAHEWKRPSETESDESVEPLSRITEGFKAERIGLSDEGQKYSLHEGTKFTTIYEEKSAVTALAWNPNPHVGGWAAAGMGDGLLRVEDISI